MECARCREAGKPIAALLLFASKRATPHLKKSAMPFCRTCFAALRKLGSNGLATEASGRTALKAASKKDHREATRVRSA